MVTYKYISQQPTGVREYLELVEKSHHLISMALEWIAEGWGLSEPPSLEQVVAALFMEAATQDECVKNGESNASWPKFLRESAYQILHLIGHKQEVEIVVDDGHKFIGVYSSPEMSKEAMKRHGNFNVSASSCELDEMPPLIDGKYLWWIHEYRDNIQCDTYSLVNNHGLVQQCKKCCKVSSNAYAWTVCLLAESEAKAREMFQKIKSKYALSGNTEMEIPYENLA
jgi:hypothetical protein